MAKKMWVFAMGLGASAMYFFDPQQGRRRRNTALDRLRSTEKKAVKTAHREASYAASKVQGTIKEVVHTNRDNPNPDDVTLADRIESELFRDERVPKGKININVAEGTVELRGQVDSQNDIDYIVKQVKKISDVKDIHNYLHLPGTPAPNKEAAIRSS
jgi:hypothetical protein